MYNTYLSYNQSSGIQSKRQYHEQDGQVNERNSYTNEYTYITGTHRLERVKDVDTGQVDYFNYDANGNVIRHESDFEGPANFYWDEQDRLRAIHSEKAESLQYYVYDDKGERTIKASLKNGSELYQNGEMIDNGLMFESFKVYPNPFAVYNSDGMLTKHYFAGDQRIASRLRDGSLFLTRMQASGMGEKKELDLQSATEQDFKNYLSKAGYKVSEIESELAGMTPAPVSGVYYLHGDHLGTATYVTNEISVPTQFFLNLPFGETMLEQQEPTSYVNPYKFNAKELDSETGLYYYGARYYIQE